MGSHDVPDSEIEGAEGEIDTCLCSADEFPERGWIGKFGGCGEGGRGDEEDCLEG